MKQLLFISFVVHIFTLSGKSGGTIQTVFGPEAKNIIEVDIAEQNGSEKKKSIVAENAKIEKAGSGYSFTEGPAVDSKGIVYFTDQPNDRIYRWDEKKGISLWLEGAGRSNGMYFNRKNQLVACADLNNRLVYFDKNKKMHILFENYDGRHLNGPNDLWIAPNG
jgi:gluconolactonase